ncbi:MAG: DUF262 domain-containing protein [Synergistaceae bacterium]|nr:DUF262 domain-containing protein [Synergistaceae bacterium]
MEAHENGLVTGIINRNKILLRIPVYQRNYSWNEEQCKMLLDDIEKIMTSEREHFFGTMVYVNLNSSERSENIDTEYIIIDGQQRITTIMLLLKALYDSGKENGDESICYEINDMLFNRYCPNYRIKLLSSNSDFEQFEALLDDKHEIINESGRIFKNYQICLARVQEWLNSNYFPSKILAAVKKLKVVAIEMGRDDDQQAIFESLNSTGLNLSNADLIRNFLLMKESPGNQKILFNNWQVIEHNLNADESDEDINNFFMHYITFISGSAAKEINKKILYRRFVDLFDEKNLTRFGILAELKNLSGIYSAFVNKDSKKKYPADVMKCLDDLRFLKQTTCYPFLLHVFDDYEKKIIDAETLSKTVKFIFSYILRRLVCKIPSNSLRGFFAALYSRAFKIQGNKQKYYESINKFISIQSSNDAMPSDEKFRDSLLNQDLYSRSSNALCKFILREIENGGSKEVLNFDDMTIEHIMPQNLSPEWRRVISSEDHDKFLHTLGNLTITGYNSELSNKSFAEKIKLLTSEDNPTKAVKLNSDVTNKSSWTVNEIKSRAERLAKIVMQLFKTEKINDPDIKFDYLTKITLDDDSSMATKQNLYSFVFDGEEYKQNTFAYMLVDVVKLLDEQNSAILEELARKNYSFTSGEKIYIKYGSDSMTNPKEIRDKIFIDTGLSAESTMKFIASLFKRYNVSKSRFYIFVKTGNISR